MHNIHAYKVYWKKDKFFHEKIEEREEFLQLSSLLAKEESLYHE